MLVAGVDPEAGMSLARIVSIALVAVVFAAEANAQALAIHTLRQEGDAAPVAGEFYTGFGQSLGTPNTGDRVLFLATSMPDPNSSQSVFLARHDPAGDVLVLAEGDPAPGAPGESIAFLVTFFGPANPSGDVPINALLSPSFGVAAYLVTGDVALPFALPGDAPPTPLTGSLQNAGNACVDASGRVVFAGSYTSDEALVRRDTSVSAPTLLVRGGDPAPDTSGTFASFGRCAMTEAGGVLFAASVSGDPSVSVAAFFRSADGSVFDRVLASGDPAPAGGTATFASTAELDATDEAFTLNVTIGGVLHELIGRFDATGAPCCLARLLPVGTTLPGLSGTLDATRGARLSQSGTASVRAAVGGVLPERLIVFLSGRWLPVISTGDDAPDPIFGPGEGISELLATERGPKGDVYFVASHDVGEQPQSLYVARNPLGAPTLGGLGRAFVVALLVVGAIARAVPRSRRA